MDKVWALKEPDRSYCFHTLRRATKGLPFADEKNPARAYTLSLLLWGGGQSYMGNRWKAVLFRALMVSFFAGIALGLLNGGYLLTLLQFYGVSHVNAFLAAECLLFLLLMFWKYNAGDAYHAAAKARKIPFQGIPSRYLPFICSLLIPGWGQYVNGQPVKGSVFAAFSLFGIFSLVTVPAVLYFWPEFEVSGSRILIETIFAAALLYLPAIPVIWFFSSYDALKVSWDDMKKESVVDRLLFTINRVRIDGWSTLFPSLRSLLILLLVATGFAYIVRAAVPPHAINDNFAAIQSWLQQRGMTIVPDLIQNILTQIS